MLFLVSLKVLILQRTINGEKIRSECGYERHAMAGGRGDSEFRRLKGGQG